MSIHEIQGVSRRQQRYQNGIMRQLQKTENQSIFDGVKKQRMMNQVASDFWKFDANHDGKITEKEATKAGFSLADFNKISRGDGNIDANEYLKYLGDKDAQQGKSGGNITKTELSASEFNPSKDEPLSTSENANIVRQPGTQGANNPNPSSASQSSGTRITPETLSEAEFNPSKDEPLSTAANANGTAVNLSADEKAQIFQEMFGKAPKVAPSASQPSGTQGVNNPTPPAPSPRPASTSASSNDVNQNFVGFKNEEEYMTHISNLTSEIMGGKATISLDEAVEKLKTKFNMDETTVSAFKRNPIGTIPQDASSITLKELSMMISMADRASGDSYDGNIEHIDLGFKNLREHPEQKISYDKAQETINMWNKADNNKIYSSYNSANETDANRKIVVGQSSDGKEITLGLIADMCKSTNLEATVGFLAEKTGQDTPEITTYREDDVAQQTSFGAIKNLQQNNDGTYVFEIEQNGQTKKFTFDGKQLTPQ